MGNTAIEGEQQTPDIFFILPSGKGAKFGPRRRDYRPDILEAVVKPWFERDEMLNPMPRSTESSAKFDWREALKAEPIPPPVPAPAVPEPVRAPALEMPAAARSLPAATVPAPAEIPSQAHSLPAAPPPPAAPAGDGDVPILVPSQ